MLTRTIIATALAVTSAQSVASDASAAAIYARSSPSIVTVLASEDGGKRRQGSGVIIDSNKVLTNCHVVVETKEIRVRFFDAQNTPGKLIGRYATLDL